MRARWLVPAVALAVALPVTLSSVPSEPAAAAEEAKQVVVDLAERTGAVHHGASGALYGLSDPGVPSRNLLEPLKIRTISQKAPDGAQHPNGDALVVADDFFATGGEYILVEMQDIYPSWPPENFGLDDYLPKVDEMVRKVMASPHREKFVYIPFNEPDWIWYELNTADPVQYAANRDRFLADWSTVHARIRALDPTARIAGPTEAYYDERFIPEFLAYSKDNGVLPDVMLWHELPTNQLEHYRANYETYRQTERDLGIEPIPVNINEYAGRRDLSVPGRLVQWVSMLEDTKVDAGGQAYWDAAGNLSGNASQSNMPTGSWWMFKMYADMTGETVSFTPPVLNVTDTVQGLASVDENRRQAHVLLGGGDGDVDVVVNNIDRETFGKSVHVTVSRTDWSGYDADAPPPVVLAETEVKVRDGSVTVPLQDIDDMSAYEVVLSPGGGGTAATPQVPWSASYEAEDAAIQNGVVYKQGTPENFNGYAASNEHDVGSLNQTDSAVTFTVDVPEDGRYRLGILYGNQSPEPSQQVLRIDGAQPRFVEYPATLYWLYRARKDVDVELTAGRHTITLAKSDPELGDARGEAGLDRLDVTKVPDDGRALPVRYEAERAQPVGAVSYSYDKERQTGAGYVTATGEAAVTFVVSVPSDGYYDVATRYATRGGTGPDVAELILDGSPLEGATLAAARRKGKDWNGSVERLYLTAGVHRVGVRPVEGAVVQLDAMTVVAAATGARPVTVIEAEAAQNEVTGGARREPNAFASNGQQVGWIGGGLQNALTLNGIQASSAGKHVLVARYANNERATGHDYNADIISRAMDVSVNGSESSRYWFRNTWAWNNFWTIGVPVTLTDGENSISLTNDSGFAPNVDRFEVAPVRVSRASVEDIKAELESLARNRKIERRVERDLQHVLDQAGDAQARADVRAMTEKLLEVGDTVSSADAAAVSPEAADAVGALLAPWTAQ